MELLHPFKAQREEAIRDHIMEVSGAAVADALTRHDIGETQPYRVEIPGEPKGINTAEYLERVQENVEEILGVIGCNDTVEYDAYISSFVNKKATDRRRKNLFTRHYHRGLSLVFREPHTAA